MTNNWWPRALVATVAMWAVAMQPAAAMGQAGGLATWRPAVPSTSPLTPMRMAALAQLPDEPWLAGHRGLDLHASPGQSVAAPAAGIVTFVGRVVDRPVVTIRHDDGSLSSVEPVASDVVVGTRVSAGAAIGTVSEVPGHCAPAVCVHWGVRVGHQYIDPLDVLAGYGPVVLLPRSAGS